METGKPRRMGKENSECMLPIFRGDDKEQPLNVTRVQKSQDTARLHVVYIPKPVKFQVRETFRCTVRPSLSYGRFVRSISSLNSELSGAWSSESIGRSERSFHHRAALGPLTQVGWICCHLTSTFVDLMLVMPALCTA